MNCRTGTTGQTPEIDSQNGTARTGQSERNRQNRTGRIILPEQDCQDTGLLGKACLDRNYRTGLPGEDWQNRTGRTGHQDRLDRTVLLGQECQERSMRTKHLEQGSQNGTDKAGQQ